VERGGGGSGGRGYHLGITLVFRGNECHELTQFENTHSCLLCAYDGSTQNFYSSVGVQTALFPLPYPTETRSNMTRSMADLESNIEGNKN